MMPAKLPAPIVFILGAGIGLAFGFAVPALPTPDGEEGMGGPMREETKVERTEKWGMVGGEKEPFDSPALVQDKEGREGNRERESSDLTPFGLRSRGGRRKDGSAKSSSGEMTADERKLHEQLNEGLSEALDPSASDRGVRATRNAIPEEVQKRVDLQRDPGGTLWVCGENFSDLHGKFDLGPALLEKLREDPYLDLGWDLAELSEESFSRIWADVAGIAADPETSIETRRCAIDGLGLRSLPRIFKDGKFWGRHEAGVALPKRGVLRREARSFAGELTDIVRQGLAPVDIRIRAADYLVRMGDHGVFPDLAALLESDVSEEARYRIRSILRKMDPAFR
ncbi:MAG: hypothetical protein ACYTFG_05385 [Planctomycetota bacterium]|jgi:hypothetical protein